MASKDGRSARVVAPKERDDAPKKAEKKPGDGKKQPLSPEELTARQKSAKDQIVKRLNDIDESNTEFFAQLELSIAGRAFAKAKAGATNMVNPDGVVSQEIVDAFHNFTDEFIRAMNQLDTGPMPAQPDYGAAANEAAKKLNKRLKLTDLQDAGRRIKKVLVEIKAVANDTPGLKDVGLADTSHLDAKGFVAHAHRVLNRADIVVSNIGLGPLFTPAIAAAKPLRENLLRIHQELNSLVSDDGRLDPAHVQSVGDWMKQALENAKNLPRSAPAWSSRELGNRGNYVISELDGLMVDFTRMKGALAKR